MAGNGHIGFGFSDEDSDSSDGEPVMSTVNAITEPLGNLTPDDQSKASQGPFPIHRARFAVIKGDLETIRKLIEGNEIPVNTPIGQHNWTLLMYAAKHANPDLLEFLIQNGADPNCRGEFGYSPLLALASTEKPHPDDRLEKCLSILIGAGADVHAKERNGLTAVHIAAKTNNQYLARRFLEAGVDKDAIDVLGRTALHHVVLLEDKTMARFLVEAGCDLSIVSEDGCKAYELACNKEFFDLAKMLYTAELTNWTPGGDTEVLNIPEQKMVLPTREEEKEKLLRKSQQIEMDLYNLGLHSLWPLFEKVNMDHFTFVCLTDDELRAIGVTKVGQRIRILDSLRAGQNQDWAESSLPEMIKQKRDGLSTPNTMRLLHNIKEHIFYMRSSLKFVKTRLLAAPGILRSGKQGMDGRELYKQLGLCGGAAGALEKDLSTVKQYFNDELDGLICLEPGDRLVFPEPTHKLRNTLITCGLIAAGYFLAKRCRSPSPA